MKRLVGGILGVLGAAASCATAPPPPPPSEAPAPRAERHVSPAAYAHYIRSQLYLARNKPNQAIEELQNALEFDPGSPEILVRLGKIHYEEGYLNRALDRCRDALEQDPTFADAYLLIGRIHKSGRNYPLAVEAFEQAIETAGTRIEAYLALGELHQEYGRSTEAARTYERMVDKIPSAANAWFRLGELALEREDWEGAERFYRLALDAEASLTEARLQLAEVLNHQGRTDEAIAEYTDVYDSRAGTESLAYTLAGLLLRQGRERAADRYFDELREVNRKDTETLRLIGETCFEASAYGRAIRAFSDALDIDPSLQEVRVYLGHARYGGGDIQGAMAEFAKVPITSSSWADARLIVGRILHEQNRFTEAASIYREMLRRRPRDKGLYQSLADVHASQGSFPKAFRVIADGLKLMPDDVHLRYHLGTLLERSGDFAAAVAEMERILQGDPDHFRALRFLTKGFAERGIRLAEAERLGQKAHLARPNDASAFDALGWVHFKMGRLEDARDQLIEAHQLNKDEPLYLERLGVVHEALKDEPAALRAWEAALALDPPPEIAFRLSSRLKGRASTPE